MAPPKRRSTRTTGSKSTMATTSATPLTCPHTATPALKAEIPEDQLNCTICTRKFFTRSADGGREMPVRLPCGCIFGKSCVDTWRETSLICPNGYRHPGHVQPLNVASCDRCKDWYIEHDEQEQVELQKVLVVRSKEMLPSINTTLQELADDDDYYKLSKKDKDKLLGHFRVMLKTMENQFNLALDLAEYLDPFLTTTEEAKKFQILGEQFEKVARPANRFPAPEQNRQNHPAGQEPWVSGFLRSWAIDYENEYGVEKPKNQWGHLGAQEEKPDGSIEGTYFVDKITDSRRNAQNEIEYRVTWKGKRYAGEISWLTRDMFEDEQMCDDFDAERGIPPPLDIPPPPAKRQRRK